MSKLHICALWDKVLKKGMVIQMKRLWAFFLIVTMTLAGLPFGSNGEGEIETEAKSVILVEASTGKVLYEKNADEPLPPASVTKIMTLLLVMEALDDGKIKLTDMVSTSERAANMGGSQVYLEPGEEMSVDEMLKCVTVASANDAAAALAEYVGGSLENFVTLMNRRAAELGMSRTRFENTNGLDDTTTTHLTTARDISIMSRELLKHEKIFDYTNIWMDTVRNGAFGLTNTNRLIRYYKGANGLKTGSTSKAGFCISATAKRDGMQLIAVIMGSPTRDERNGTAVKLLDYGFAGYEVYRAPEKEIRSLAVTGGKTDCVNLIYEDMHCVLEKGCGKKVEIKAELPEKLIAPVKEGEVVGKISYMLDGKELACGEIRAEKTVEKLGWWDIFLKFLEAYTVF